MKREDYRNWLKRFRKALEPHKIRIFGVGEYGDLRERPHYHAAVFGFPPCRLQSWKWPEALRGTCRCPECGLIHKSWNKGNVECAELSFESAQYVAGYVTKKMTNKKDKRLKGREPEFAAPSNRPGIGALSMKKIAEVIACEDGARTLLATGDVPMSLNHGIKQWPFGRYLRKKIREYYGFSKTDAQEGWALRASQELCRMQEDYESDPKNSGKPYHVFFKEQMEQKILNLEAKHNLYTKKGGIG